MHEKLDTSLFMGNTVNLKLRKAGLKKLFLKCKQKKINSQKPAYAKCINKTGTEQN